MIVTGAPSVEVFFSVTVPVPVGVPVGSVMVSGLGVIDTVPRATPVPVSVTGEPVTGTLALMVNVPLTRPVAVGVNTTLMLQAEPAVKVAPQVPPAAPAGRE